MRTDAHGILQQEGVPGGTATRSMTEAGTGRMTWPRRGGRNPVGFFPSPSKRASSHVCIADWIEVKYGCYEEGRETGGREGREMDGWKGMSAKIRRKAMSPDAVHVFPQYRTLLWERIITSREVERASGTPTSHRLASTPERGWGGAARRAGAGGAHPPQHPGLQAGGATSSRPARRGCRKESTSLSPST